MLDLDCCLPQSCIDHGDIIHEGEEHQEEGCNYEDWEPLAFRFASSINNMIHSRR